MIDDRQDPLARVVTGLARLSPNEARAARVHARCARLYDATRNAEREPAKRGTWVVGVLSAIYLVELTKLAVRLSFWRL